MNIFYLIALCISLLISISIYAQVGDKDFLIFASLVHVFWFALALMMLVYLYRKLLKKNYQI